MYKHYIMNKNIDKEYAVLNNIKKINKELDNVDLQIEKSFTKNTKDLEYYKEIINKSILNFKNITKNLSK